MDHYGDEMTKEMIVLATMPPFKGIMTRRLAKQLHRVVPKQQVRVHQMG